MQASPRARLLVCSSPCCQVRPHDIVAGPPTETNIAISAQGGARRQTRPIYPPSPAPAPNTIRYQYAPAPTNRKYAVVHGQTAARHSNRQVYPKITATAADDGFRASEREAALAAQLLDVRRRARNEHDYAMKRIRESAADAVAHGQRADEAERGLTLIRVSRCSNIGIVFCKLQQPGLPLLLLLLLLPLLEDGD